MLNTTDAGTLPGDLLPGTGEGTRLMAFGAPWCGPWKLLQGELDRMEAEGVTVVRVNVDEHSGLADMWAVVSLPTFVVVVEGEERRRYIGSVAASELDAGMTFTAKAGSRTKMRRRR